MIDVIGKITQILIFAVVSVIFVPVLILAHYCAEPYEKWLEKVLKL